MRRNLFLFLASVLLASLLQAQDSATRPDRLSGTAPRASSAKYRAHGEQDGVGIGAELLAKKDVTDAFAADLNHCCIVVQVAVYPGKDAAVDLSPLDFTLVEEKTDTSVRAESPTVVAAKLEKRKTSGGSGTDVTTSTGVGYESGTYTDPVTGQPVHVRGVTTSAGVGVATGNYPRPEVADHDREIMERELYEKGLPEAKVAIPVSGYLYFPIPKSNSKSSKDVKYSLVYSGSALTEPLVLPLK